LQARPAKRREHAAGTGIVVSPHRDYPVAAIASESRHGFDIPTIDSVTFSTHRPKKDRRFPNLE